MKNKNFFIFAVSGILTEENGSAYWETVLTDQIKFYRVRAVAEVR